MPQEQPTPMKRRASALHPVTTTDVGDDDAIYTTRLPTSTRRYRKEDNTKVFEQGDRRLVVHYQKPPRAKIHWFVPAGMGAIAMLLIIFMVSTVGNWLNNYQTDQKYGYPRHWETDVVVGHNDSDQHPSHFIFENLHGHVLIIEISGGDAAHSRLYTGPVLVGDNADTFPVTATFDDETGKGTIDMVVHVQDQRIIYLNDGTQFKQQ